MQKELPDWAWEPATAEDLARAREAMDQGRLELKLPDAKDLQKWARQHGWRVPWLGFERAFVTQMLQDEPSFALALSANGLEVRLLKREHYTGRRISTGVNGDRHLHAKPLALNLTGSEFSLTSRLGSFIP